MQKLDPSNLPPEIKATIEEAKRIAAENDANGTWVSGEEVRALMAAMGVSEEVCADCLRRQDDV